MTLSGDCFRVEKSLAGPLEAKSDCKMAHLFPCEEAQAPPQPKKKRLLNPNPEIRTIKILRSFLLEWSTSVRMLKPSLSEWFQVKSQSFLTFWTEWPGTHLQEERRATWVQIPPAHCNLQILGPQHQSQLPYHQFLSLHGEEEAVYYFWAFIETCL